MPNQPRTPARSVRVPDDLWAAATKKAAERGDSLSQVIRDALRGYVGQDSAWPVGGGYSPSGNTWLCRVPGCGFGVSGLLDDGGEGDPVAEHMADEHGVSIAPASRRSGPDPMANLW